MPTVRNSRGPSAAQSNSESARLAPASSKSSGQAVASLESVIITDELARRAALHPSYEAENRAYLTIARAAAESPERVFERLAQAALSLCRAHSAGVSLFDHPRKRFHWRVIAGEWAAHTGGDTPANFSPCGTVFERNAPQLFHRPERYFPYLAPVRPPIEEILMIPFYANGAAAGTIWVTAHDRTRHFDCEDLRVITNLTGFASSAYQLLDAAREDELAAARQLQKISTEMIRSDNAGELYEKLLNAASVIMRSDFASMQMLDANRGELRLLAFSGFPADAAKFWEWVRPASGSTCGRAMETRQRVFVSDVETCKFMVGTEDLHFYRRSKIRAVQSTPLLSRSGELLGMLSTHWRQPHTPAERELRLFDVLARQAADIIDRRQSGEALQRANELLEIRVQTRTHELEAQIRETKRVEEGLRAVTERLFKIQDDERRHIARELHAGASQALAALSMSLGRLTKMATHVDELELIHECHAMIEQVTREIGTISYLLHPPLLEELGLAFALRAYAEGFSERSGIPVRVENDKLLEQLPDASEIAVFRVVQESLSNIHRHSGATEARIRIAECAGGLQLTISDNGKGVSEEKQRELAESARAGVGILGMRERIRQLGGTLEIVSGVPSPGAAADFAEAFSFYGKGASVGEERRARTTGAECKAQPANAKPIVTQRSAAAKTSGHRTAALVARATKSAGAARNEFATRNRARHTIKSVGPGTCVSVTVPLPRAAHA